MANIFILGVSLGAFGLQLPVHSGRAIRYIPNYQKLRPKKLCFSKSGDAAVVPNANLYI
jgi:hypothetical protein